MIDEFDVTTVGTEDVLTESAITEEVELPDDSVVRKVLAIIVQDDLSEESLADVPVSEEVVSETSAEEVSEDLSVKEFEIVEEVSVTEAEVAMSDETAASLIETKQLDAIIKMNRSRYKAKAIVNVDTLSVVYNSGDTVTLESLKEKKILSQKIGSFKVLGRGIIDKPLNIEADNFSLNAAKMILLTGGRVIRISK